MSLDTVDRTKLRRQMDRLSRVKGAFYGRFYKPRPIQFEVIEPILQGKSAVISSCTASGKTEAYLAPLTERWFEPMRAGRLCVLIICPTRALANDLVKRISVPLEHCAIKVLLRTGDHPTPIRDKKAGVLVTTLESLDSLLCRWAAELIQVKTVVFEELHVAEGTARGDQLAVLAERLDVLLHCAKAKQIEGTLGRLGLSLQRLAVTATPGNSEIINRKYLGGHGIVIENRQGLDLAVDFSRPVAFEAPAHITKEQLGCLAVFRSCIKYCSEHNCRKMLVFVRSRAEAEQLVSIKKYLMVNPFGEAVFSHHGSLGTEQREKTEKNFAALPSAICFATSTLEVGIDIGDVDAVALTVPPPDVNAFLQRAGRSGRRGQVPRILCLYFNELEKLCYSHLVEAARKAQLCSEHPPFLSSVLVQQAVSLVCQSSNDMINESALHKRLPLYLRSYYTEEVCGKILRGAADKGLLKCRTQGGYSRSEKLKELFERGEMHHNISMGGSSDDGIKVVDRDSNIVIGILSAGSKLSPGDFFHFGGSSYRVLSIADDGAVSVCTDMSVNTDRLRRCKFSGRSMPAVSEQWARHFASFLKFPPNASCYASDGDNYIICSHFMGTSGAVFLNAISLTLGCTLTKVSPYVLLSGDRNSLEELALSAASLKMVIRQNIKTLASKLDLGPWSSYLDGEMLEREVFKVAEHIHLLDNLRQFNHFVRADAHQSAWLCAAAESLMK
ncbi:MAG: DEAD/DEAH box helicase [Candidatus Bruticola sp.]